MSTLLDIKYALRLLFKAPKFSALVLFVLIGGLSISLFTFSFMYSLLHKPLPLTDGETVLKVQMSIDGIDERTPGYEFSQVREGLTSFAELGAYSDKLIRLSINEEGKKIVASYVEADFFHFSRTAPSIGRALQQADMAADAQPVVVMSHQIWHNYFNAEPNIVGQAIKLNGLSTTVVGVMPPNYQFPVNSELWLPMPQRISQPAAQSEQWLEVYGRIKPGTSISDAEAEMTAAMDIVYQQRVKLYNQPPGELRATLMSFASAQLGNEGKIAFTFLNLVAFAILLLACINVGNLLLSRAIARQKETAIRAALGAPTHRLISQLMWEGALITILGAVLSLLLVAAALDYTNISLRSYLPDGVAFWWYWGIDLPTVLMAIGFTAVTLFMASFLPAWRAASQDVNATLRDGTRGAQGKKAGRISRLLVTVQIFLISTLMMVGSLVAFMSQHMVNIDLGENFDQLMRASISLPLDKYQKSPQQSAFNQELVNRLRQQPNVTDALIKSTLGEVRLTLEGMDYARDEDKPRVYTEILIGNTQFYGSRLLKGRHLNRQDKQGARQTALISESMANRYWPGESVIDKRIQLDIDDKNQWFYVVGVVTDRTNPRALFAPKNSEDEIYISGLQVVKPTSRIYFKYSGNDEQAQESFYRALLSMDRNIEPERLGPAAKDLNMMRGGMQFASNLTFGAGGFALLLALTGIYGLTANSVSGRTQETGVRRAVGATDRQIVMMFLSQGVKQLVTGLGLGLAVFSLFAFGFSSFSSGLIPWYLYVILALTVTATLVIVVLAAIYIPTRQAVAMEPGNALRYE